jgi:hypothetical protein
MLLIKSADQKGEIREMKAAWRVRAQMTSRREDSTMFNTEEHSLACSSQMMRKDDPVSV